MSRGFILKICFFFNIQVDADDKGFGRCLLYGYGLIGSKKMRFFMINVYVHFSEKSILLFQ